MYQHVLFEDIAGRPVPRTRRTADGRERRPDGVRFFDLDGAVQKFGMPRATLLSVWDDAYADLPWARSPVVGMPALEADEECAAPVAPVQSPVQPPAPQPPRDDTALGALRRVHFGHLSDDQFRLFIEECNRRGLDPFCKQVVARVEEDWRTGEERVCTITTVGAFILLAQRTGQFEGLTPVQWCGEDGVWKELWPDGVQPFAARQGVYRKGFREPVWGTVYWKERAPYWPTPGAAAGEPATVLDKFWEDQPRHMIGKCARVEAIRQAFGEELAGMHTFDEMQRADAQARPGGGNGNGRRRRSIEDVFKPQTADADAGRDAYAIPSGRRLEPIVSARDLPDDAIPENDEEFAGALRRLGFDDPDVRKRVIGYWHGQLSALFNCNPTAAYAKALERVRENPEHFGARPRGRRSA
jgi:phage recombination protein Bet